MNWQWFTFIIAMDMVAIILAFGFAVVWESVKRDDWG